MKQMGIKIEAEHQGEVGKIRIVDYIGSWDNNSLSVAQVAEDFKSSGVVEIDLYINSKGGSTFEADEIVNVLKDFDKVVITVGALAASAATYLMTHFKAKAFASSQFMIHAPMLSFQGNLKAIKSQIKLLENTTEMYAQAYASKMNISVDEVKSIFDQGDYWLNAQEALKKGLIDEIINDEHATTATDVALLSACGAPVIPKPVVNTVKTDKKMNIDDLKSKLKLDADASEEQVMSALEAKLKSANEADALKAKAENQQKDLVEAMVNKAIADKKITADTKDKYVELGMKSYQGVKAILEAMPGVSKLSSQLGDPRQSTRADWALEDYLENDPEAYVKLKEEQPEVAAKLEKEYFK